MFSKKYRLRLIAIAFASLAFAWTIEGCGHTHSEHEGEAHHHDHEDHDHEGHGHEGEHSHKGEESNEKHGDEVVLNHEALESAGLEFETSARGSFHEVLKCAAIIENSRGAERVIAAPASGIVTFSSGIVNGAQVKAGQGLFHISSENTEQGDAAATAGIERDLMAKELKRAEELIKDNLISRKEYDQIKANYERAQKDASSVAARNRKGMSVSSPIAGTLINVTVAPGSFVNMGDPLATVATDRRLLLRAELSERDRDFIPRINGAVIRSGSGDNAIPLEASDVKVLSTNAATNAQSHFIPVYLEFNNPGGLGSGNVVEVWLTGNPRDGVLTVPRRAIIEDGGLKFVFVEEEKGIFHKHEVTTGATDGNRVEILSGLPEGEKVVTSGALRIKLAGMASSIPGHTHHH